MDPIKTNTIQWSVAGQLPLLLVESIEFFTLSYSAQLTRIAIEKQKKNEKRQEINCNVRQAYVPTAMATEIALNSLSLVLLSNQFHLCGQFNIMLESCELFKAILS